MSMVMGFLQAFSQRNQSPAMIRRPHPHEIKLLPQIENEADLRYRRVGLGQVVDMPPASLASLEAGRREGRLWVAVWPSYPELTPTARVKDKIIVSVKTDATTPADATIEAKLTFQDGQEAGKQSATVKAEDAGTTNIEFTKATDWPAGKYKVDVTLNGQPVGMTQEIEVK